MIDKSPVGTTRSQHLVLRGQFGRPQAFFFDDIPGGDRSLDLFGEVLAVVAADGAVDLEVNAQRRRTKYDGKRSDRAGITSHLHLSPEDTAAVELPIGSPGDPFASHELSLRVRCRELPPAVGAQAQSVFGAKRAPRP